MVVNNPNNWHWVDKNCIAWSKDYFTERLVGIKGENDTKQVSITGVSSVEGDCEVSQRKGKVISLFDLKLVLQYKGLLDKSNSESTVTGSITVPELAYDTEADEIQFTIGVYNESNANDEIKPVIRTEIIPQLRKILANFGTELIEVHSSDIQLESDKVNSVFTKANQEAQHKKSNIPKTASTQSNASGSTTSANQSSSSTPNPSSNNSVPKYNTSTLHLEPEFTAPAEQLYITLLDPQRIAAWSRSPPLIEPLPVKEGTNMKLFGGSITSKVTKLVPNLQITQDWRLEDWKPGHYAKLDIKLKEGSGETKMIVKFDGIPIGEEDRVRGNFEDYYIRSIKITFGFGAVL